MNTKLKQTEESATRLISIKNMVCPRCIESVEQLMLKLGFKVKSVKLGEVEVEESKKQPDDETLNRALKEKGFSLASNRDEQLVEKIKALIVEKIHFNPEKPKMKTSDFLTKELGYSYPTISRIFSIVEGTTVEKYVILQRLEKVKELLSYQEMTLSEIAVHLGYRSVQHLSAQFHEQTGITVSEYKRNNLNLRKPLDNVTEKKS